MDIFSDNSRVEALGGLHFYEQDVVMLKYLYNGDVFIDLSLEYRSPGIGIVFSSYSQGKNETDDPSKAFLIDIGAMSCSVYYKNFESQSRIYYGSSILSPDKEMHYLRFEKDGTYLYAYEHNDKDRTELFRKNMNMDLDSFYLGIYSAAGNIIHSMNIYDNRPQFWFTNIENTNGGRISFEQNAFKVEQAEHAIETEQQNIGLKKGRYYLDFKQIPVNDSLASKVFVFP